MITKNKDSHNEVDLDRFRSKKRRWWVLVPFLLILAIGLWYGITILLAVKNATTANTNPNLAVLRQNTSKTPDQINVLLIGIGGDNHPGGTLADSIMVASINPQSKVISLLSVPRDLYVSIPGNGKDKINAAHADGESHGKGGGPALLKQVVSDTLGIPIHYFVRVDFEGFKKIVDTVGGVTVDVKKSINDPLYPDTQMKGYDPFSISAGMHTLDGATALKYARSRETTSDFDRARRQQQILSAVKDKILTAQVLANPKKVTDIISVLGKHILTDFSPSEIDQLLMIGRQMGNPTVHSAVLDNGDTGLLISSHSAAGAYILVPKAGPNDFSDIQIYVKGYFAQPMIQAEKPTIEIQRAGTSKEVATKVGKQLENAGFEVSYDEMPITDVKASTLYSLSAASKEKSLAYIKDVYGIKVSTGHTSTPSSLTSPSPSTTDFLLIIAPDLSKLSKTTNNKPANPFSSPALLTGGTTPEEDGAIQSVTE